MNENKKRNLFVPILVIMAVALIVAYAKINSLESTVRMLRNDLNHSVSDLESRVNSIYGNVDEFLKQEASLLSGVEAEYGELNLEDHTIDVAVKLVPKLISENMKVHVSFNDRTAELVRSGSTFSGSIPVDIYNMGEQMILTIETEAGSQTQYLHEIRTEYLWEGKIPSLYHCGITGTGKLSEGKYSLRGQLDINCSPAENTPSVRFEKFVLVTELNGAEINREDISEDILSYEAYPHGVYWRDAYTMECAAQEGDELAIYVEATDSLGYLHRRLLHFWKEYKGAVAEAVDASEYIFDPNGVPIFP